MAVSNVALFGAAFLTPVVVGKITKTMGWQWSFYFVAIFLGASLPLMFFFVPETAFRRPENLNTDFKRRGAQGESSESHLSLGASNDGTKELSPGSSAAVETAIPVPEKDSFVKSLRLFNGRKTDESFFKLLLRPFPLFFHPGILWVSGSLADELNILTGSGMPHSRCRDRLGSFLWSDSSNCVSRATIVVRGRQDRLSLHGGLHRLHCGSGSVRVAFRLYEQIDDSVQPRQV